jgi:(1->4)-alpha-D-glucan 1-alpha-D-glucosylmutase
VDDARLSEYALKAVREAKDHTSWTRPDASYEAAVVALVERVCADEGLMSAVDEFVAALDPAARRTEIAQKVLQLMSPGVADLYWGSEDRTHRLVDPDNRVPPDLERLRTGLTGEAEADGADHDLAKLRAVATVVALRRRHRDCCTVGSYRPLEVDGPDAERVAAFARGGDLVVVVTRWPSSGPVGADTGVELPEGRWEVRLGADGVEVSGGRCAVSDLLGDWSASVLERVG